MKVFKDKSSRWFARDENGTEYTLSAKTQSEAFAQARSIKPKKIPERPEVPVPDVYEEEVTAQEVQADNPVLPEGFNAAPSTSE